LESLAHFATWGEERERSSFARSARGRGHGNSRRRERDLEEGRGPLAGLAQHLEL